MAPDQVLAAVEEAGPVRLVLVRSDNRHRSEPPIVAVAGGDDLAAALDQAYDLLVASRALAGQHQPQPQERFRVWQDQMPAAVQIGTLRILPGAGCFEYRAMELPQA